MSTTTKCTNRKPAPVKSQGINVVFDGPITPEGGPRFIEVETDDGFSVNCGEWIRRKNGTWSLRFTAKAVAAAASDTSRKEYLKGKARA